MRQVVALAGTRTNACRSSHGESDGSLRSAADAAALEQAFYGVLAMAVLEYVHVGDGARTRTTMSRAMALLRRGGPRRDGSLIEDHGVKMSARMLFALRRWVDDWRGGTTPAGGGVA